ncbi:MAG: hypothetical protein QF886_19610, partial [Planctomycetota bacterium]|nr:hypothetical protein [Planctomycetota bacterium]
MSFHRALASRPEWNWEERRSGEQRYDMRRHRALGSRPEWNWEESVLRRRRFPLLYRLAELVEEPRVGNVVGGWAH